MSRTMQITVTDVRWPKLTLVVHREPASGGGAIVTQDSQQYDGAYNIFEGIIHNHLRELVAGVIKSKKGQNTP